MNLKFYSLLFVQDDTEKLVENFGSSSSKPPKIKDLELYAKSCRNLMLSLNAQDLSYAVLTNKPELLKQLEPELNVIKIDFDFDIPKDIKFYGAHFKIDTFRWFAKQKEDYSVLLDIDEICVNPMPQNMCKAIENNLALFYDVTDQMYPDAGRERLINDLQLFCPEADLGLWAGGEFIGGTADFFDKLYAKVTEISGKYFSVQKELFHKGDESLVSAALQSLLKEGLPMINAGSFGAISRFWSCGTKHCQKLFPAIKDCFLLHLPADKQFLAENKYDQKFLSKYEKYLQTEKAFDTQVRLPRLFFQRAKNKLLRLFKLK